MNRPSLARFLFAAALLVLPIAGARAQSQNEMNQQARAAFDKADAALNRAYKTLLSSLDAEGQAKLKAAQRAWITFRDAEAAYQADAEARGGSLAPLIYSSTAEELTRARTRQLLGQAPSK